MNKLSSCSSNKSATSNNSSSTMTTDALIVNSNSHLVSDEIILQLQEQFGDSKQIYILNSSNQSLVSSDSYNNGLYHQQPVQYLVVDKDVDINLILQDPNIFNNNSSQISQTQTNNNNNNNNNNNRLISKNALGSNLIMPATTATSLIEESVQRVQVPPPKRKKFEFKFENKKNSYQDAFLRYLAGEKQPSLDSISNEQTNNSNIMNNVKKPKDNISYSTRTATSPHSINNQSISNYTTIAINNGGLSTPVNSTSNSNDKENYYNSSRRENLMPLNNYEYRNSYKDHYDNQGVRLNPAILKNLPSSGSTSSVSSSFTPTTISQIASIPTSTTSTNNNNNKQQACYQRPPSRIIVTKSKNNLISKIAPITSNSSATTHSDHTYKMQETNCYNKCNNKNELTPLAIQPQQMATNDLSGINIENDHHQQQVLIDSDLISTNTHQQQLAVIEEVKFLPGEFLIHKSTFTGDFENYDIWCVLNDEYLQKYEPVLLSTGERCHQSADVLAQYAQDKTEFLVVKVEEKGKTEQNNIVVGVLSEYEPKNNKIYSKILLNQQQQQQHNQQPQEIIMTNGNGATNAMIESINIDKQQAQQQALISANSTSSSSNNANPTSQITSSTTQIMDSSSAPSANQSNHLILVTFDDLKRTFDVFLQVLLSQYLNNEFLVKIKELNDEYFKPSLDLIDTILQEKYDLILQYLNEFLCLTNKNVKLKPLFKYLLENKPKLELNEIDSTDTKNCESLIYENDERIIFSDLIGQHLIKFGGLSYNLENLQPLFENNLDEMIDTINLIANFYDQNHHPPIDDPNNKSNSGQFLVCTKMLQITQFLHSLKHFKINYFELCSQKIESVKAERSKSFVTANHGDNANKTSNDENSTNTELLNYCLADTKWLLEMFEKFKQLLFDIDGLLSTSTTLHTTSSNTSLTSGVTLLSNAKLLSEKNLLMNDEAIMATGNTHLNHVDDIDMASDSNSNLDVNTKITQKQ